MKTNNRNEFDLARDMQGEIVRLENRLHEAREEIERFGIGCRRYEIARKMNPEQWRGLYQRSLITGVPFDDLIDEWGSFVQPYIGEQKPAQDGLKGGETD